MRYVTVTGDAGRGGANLEVKPGDATANPYYAAAAVLLGAADGVRRGLVPPAPVEVDPGRLSLSEREARGIHLLPSTLAEALALLDANSTLRSGLGHDLVDLYLAVRAPDA